MGMNLIYSGRGVPFFVDPEDSKSNTVKMIKADVLLLIFLPMISIASELPGKQKNETQTLHVRGELKYRCYAGYDDKKNTKKNVVDEFTKEACDINESHEVVINKDIAIELKKEPTPDGNQISGSWSEQFRFKKRKFNIAFSLFKEPNQARPYRLAIYVSDDQPTLRRTDVITKFKSSGSMNDIEINHESSGTKEEISFTVNVSPPTKN